jgi:HEAT repeat protein
MNLLTIVATTAVILTILSFILLLGIILLRLFTDRSLDHESDFRKKALPVIIAFIEGKADTATSLAVLRKEHSLALQLLMEESSRLGRVDSLRLQPLYDGLSFEKHALKSLQSRVWQSRLHAADTLGYTGREDSVPPLMSALRDEVIAVRFAAARSLVRLQCLDAVDTILHSLDVPGEVSQRRVAEILFPLGSSATEPILKVLGTPSVNDASRAIAARLAGMLHLERAVPALSHLLSHQSANVRLNCVRSLASIGDRSSITTIASLGEDPSWEVRSSVMQALGKLGAEEQVPLLLQGLSDQEWWVRHNAGEALLAIGDQGTKALRDAADHHVDAYGRDMSKQILQRHGLLEVTTESLS